jgi:hypothetical protein
VTEILFAFGFIFILLGLGAAIRPHTLLRLARKVRIKTWLRLLAFGVRLGIGVILLLVAASTAFPLAIQVIGVLLIASAVVVLVVGNDGLQRIIGWALGLGPVAVVAGGVIGIACGGLLIYAAW